MITKYYVDADGNYLGGFQGNTGKLPVGAIEVPVAPSHAKDKWNGASWIPDPVIQKEILNAPIKSQIAALDAKRVRPLAEGDSAHLRYLNDKIAALRSKLA